MDLAVSVDIEQNRSNQEAKKTKQQKVKDALVAKNQVPFPVIAQKLRGLTVQS